jgi:phage baseplate assembly protein gpV
MAVTVTGASDDLIEIAGELEAEFNHNPFNEDDCCYLAFSDGTILKIRYDKDGIWRINSVIKGNCNLEIKQGDVSKDTFDVATLSGYPINWVMVGTDYYAKKGN